MTDSANRLKSSQRELNERDLKLKDDWKNLYFQVANDYKVLVNDYRELNHKCSNLEKTKQEIEADLGNQLRSCQEDKIYLERDIKSHEAAHQETQGQLQHCQEQLNQRPGSSDKTVLFWFLIPALLLALGMLGISLTWFVQLSKLRRDCSKQPRESAQARQSGEACLSSCQIVTRYRHPAMPDADVDVLCRNQCLRLDDCELFRKQRILALICVILSGLLVGCLAAYLTWKLWRI